MLYIKNFLKYTVHIGHSFASSLMLSSWFFFKLKKNVWVINIFKTIIFLKIILKFLKFLVNNELPIWFINFEYTKEKLFRYSAKMCGEFACTKKWVRGFLSNFKSIQKSVKNFAIKKFAHKKSFFKMHLIDNWVFTRYTWPRSIFLSNVPLNYVICKEASDILLPVIAMVDTNIKSYLFHYPIPSNDDSFKSIYFIINILSIHILLCKYKKVLLWFNKYKLNNFKSLKLLKNIVSNSKLKETKNIKKFFLKIVRNQNFSSILNMKLFHSLRNMRKSIKKIYASSPINFTSHIIRYSDVFHKIHLIKKLKLNNIFFRRILKRKYKFSSDFGILDTLNRLPSLIRLKKKKKWSYYRYLFLTKLIKKTRLFHESFIINKPSNIYFLHFFQQSHKFTKNHSDEKDWCYFRNYRIKLNRVRKEKWLENKFNKKLLEDEETKNISSFADSAILLNTDRWITPNILYDIMRKTKRTILNYWLIPFIKRFSVRDNYSWFHSRFYRNKEDEEFRTSITWNLPKVNAPISTLNYYTNWFFYVLRTPNKVRRSRARRKRILTTKIKLV